VLLQKVQRFIKFLTVRAIDIHAIRDHRLPITTDSVVASFRQGEPPSLALARIARIIDLARNSEGSNFEWEPPKSLCGKVANVAVWEAPQWDRVKATMSVGGFVRMRNIHEGDLYDGLKCEFSEAALGHA